MANPGRGSMPISQMGNHPQETRVSVILQYIEECHLTALEHGFWDHSDSLPALSDSQTGLKLMLIVTELGEWMEGIRHGDHPSDHIPQFTASEEEAADVLIRIFDLAGATEMRLAEALEAKIAYNNTREHMHGKTC
jgi:NTP pyrophosphatase (non-canonical NTP hydrolase)